MDIRALLRRLKADLIRATLPWTQEDLERLGPEGYTPFGNFLIGPVRDPFHCTFQNSLSNRLHNEPIQMRHVFNRHSLEMKFSMYQCHCSECAQDTFDAGLLTMLEQETSQHASRWEQLRCRDAIRAHCQHSRVEGGRVQSFESIFRGPNHTTDRPELLLRVWVYYYPVPHSTPGDRDNDPNECTPVESWHVPHHPQGNS